MTRVYENRGYWWRQTISAVLVIVVAIYGLWELWSAASAPGTTTAIGQMFGIGDDRYLFGIVFVGGGAIALYQLIRDATDLVASFDRDEATGVSIVALWRPFWTEKLTADLSRIHDWRFHVKIGQRNARTPLIYADHPDYPRPLQFDLRKADREGLRKIAPEAVADYERAVAPPKAATSP